MPNNTQDISMQWEESQQPNITSSELAQNSMGTVILDTAAQDGVNCVVQDTQKRMGCERSPNLKRTKLLDDAVSNVTQSTTMATRGESPQVIPNTNPDLAIPAVPPPTNDETLVAPTGEQVHPTASISKTFVIEETPVPVEPVVNPLEEKVASLESELSMERQRADTAEQELKTANEKIKTLEEQRANQPTNGHTNDIYVKGDNIMFTAKESSHPSFGRITEVATNTVTVVLYAALSDTSKKRPPTHASWTRDKTLILLSDEQTVARDRIARKIVVLKGDALDNTYCLKEMITADKTLKAVA
eukprot:TRINITY_DN5189_c0_g3_i1.p1 TRINITY_DN5189_c0_g3~~TRINITY_DN5189_c0_g3_i1.p1  ORF type:complete len:320 (+),score=77.47 TRINITY_DN5189_c0_g3_i1:57-962(+)